jgi:PAS domain S-box-containing protein
VREARHGAQLDHLERATDEGLAASEEFFGFIVKGVQEYSILLLDPKGRIATWNAGAAQAYGYTAEEIVGQHFSCLFPREMAEASLPARQLDIAQVAGRFEEEGWHERKDGSWFWANAVTTAIWNEAGVFQGYSTIIRNVTPRKREEDELRRSEQRFRLLVDGVREYAIFLLDREGSIASWNAGAARIIGYQAEGIIGQHMTRFYPAEDVLEGKPDRLLKIAREDGQIVDEGWRVRQDGSRFWASVLITALYDADGDLKGYSKIIRDLTERKRTEQALLTVVNSVVDGIITTDESGRIESFNPAAERIFGYAAHEMIGQNVKLLIPEPFHREEDDLAAGSSTRMGKAKMIGVGREVVGRRKDGATFPMDLAVTSFRMGERRYFTGIMRDITDSKRQEQEMRERLAELAEADNQKNDFLAMLGHELRNPLAPIRNALHILNMPGASAKAVAQARDAMERQVQHVVRLVDDLLDVSRIMRAKIDLRKEVTDLTSIIHSAVETAQPVIDAQGHELTVSLPKRKIPLEADVVRMAQVISNLLMNAAKYTDHAGRIWLTIERDGPDAALIRVKDSGIGIAPELLPRVFDLFVQGHRSLARSQGGLGIGLTLAKNLVEMHGGTISAHSQGVGQGSEFVIRLPILANKRVDPGHQTPPKSTHIQGPARRILVVDDNVDAAELTATLLAMWGHEVRTLHDGPSVLTAVESFHPELILLDIGLPGMSGYDVARELRQRPEGKGIVLAAMTGYGQDKDRSQSREAGFDYHLTKPLDPNLLEAFVAAPHTFSLAAS